MKSQISNLGLSVPVGTSDAGAYFNNEVLANVDFAVRLSCHFSLTRADWHGPGCLIACERALVVRERVD